MISPAKILIDPGGGDSYLYFFNLKAASSNQNLFITVMKKNGSLKSKIDTHKLKPYGIWRFFLTNREKYDIIFLVSCREERILYSNPKWFVKTYREGEARPTNPVKGYLQQPKIDLLNQKTVSWVKF